jgi:hypothetical protein
MKPLFEVYSQTADRFENGGWTQGAYGRPGTPACLVGGLNQGLLSVNDDAWSVSFSAELPEQIVADVTKRLRRYPTYWLCWAIECGERRWAMEAWNDGFPWRRRGTVVKVMRSLARKYEGAYWHTKYNELLAERDELKAKLERSETRRRNLLTRIASERTIAADERELARLDTELDRVAALIG